MFSESTLRRLDRLALVAQRVRAGVFKGERRSTKRGTSIEFADYRDYVRGDDLRRIDWNAYARLERPFIKLLEEEEDLAVHVLVDASLSMGFGQGEQRKLDYACKLGAAFGYLALAAGDRLTVSVLNGEHVAARFGPVRNRGFALRLIRFLEDVKPAGDTRINAALRDYALTGGRPGLTFLISDLFAPDGYADGLAQLQGRGHEVAVVHVLAPEEVEPEFAGDLRLVDAETQDFQEITLDGGLRDLYHARLNDWRDEINAHCTKRGMHYVPVVTDAPWDQLVLHQLRQRGLVK